jgi:hypothetical protein
MNELVMAIALPLAKQYGMNKALEIAYEKLGIAAPQEQDPFIYGMNQPFVAGNIGDSIKRSLLKKGVGTVFNSMPSGALPILGVAGLAGVANKYRKQLTGYDTQSAYEAARDQRRADKRLAYITDRMINNKKTANYEEALLDSGAGAVEIDGTIYSGADYQGGDNNNDRGQDIGPTTSSSVKYTKEDSNRERGRYSEGGIASLWQR